MPKTTWKPRSSSVGYYMACHYRAAMDRALAEGQAAPEIAAAVADKEAHPSPYADLGTCIHFVMQDGGGCVWPGPAKDYAPTEAEWLNAASLDRAPYSFGGDVEKVRMHAHRVASIGAAHLPKPADGKPWLAETAWSKPYAQGHIDFLSQDHEDLWDLKTTTRPPAGHIKPAHLFQMLTYRLLVNRKPKRGGILYVSSAGEWATAVSFDFTTPDMEEMTDQTLDFLKHVRGANLYKTAFPQVGSQCGDNFCPYLTICRDRFLPAVPNNGVKHHGSPLAKTPCSGGSSLFAGT